MKNENGSIYLDIQSCARCGKNHNGIKFQNFQKLPFKYGRKVWTMWGICPETGDPILLRNN